MLAGEMTTKIIVVAATTVSIMVISCVSNTTDIRMCYFRSYAANRTTQARFEIKDIDFTLCTHYIYAYASVDDFTRPLPTNDSAEQGGPSLMYRQFNEGKKTSPSIKTLLSVGGPGEVSDTVLPGISVSDFHLNALARTALNVLTHYGFDGLDLDWDYPDTNAEKITHAKILKTLRQEFDSYNGTRPILTSTGDGVVQRILPGYNVSEMVKYVDYVIIKTHNVVLPGLTFTHFFSPLILNVTDANYSAMSMSASVGQWAAAGLPYNKMVVGISARGTYLELSDSAHSAPGAHITTTVMKGLLYNFTSALAYPEVCIIEGAVKYLDPIQKNPYLVQGPVWVGFENNESLYFKLEWLKPLGVAGIMFAALDEDDFTGQACATGRFPLLSFIKSYMTTALTTAATTTVPGQTTKGSSDEEASAVLLYIVVFIFLALACLFACLVLFCLRRRKKPELVHVEK